MLKEKLKSNYRTWGLVYVRVKKARWLVEGVVNSGNVDKRRGSEVSGSLFFYLSYIAETYPKNR